MIYILLLQDQIYYLRDWNLQNQHLEGLVTHGLKEKECFTLCILKDKVMAPDLPSTTADTLKQKHTTLKNEKTNRRSFLSAILGDSPAILSAYLLKWVCIVINLCAFKQLALVSTKYMNKKIIYTCFYSC